MCKNRAWSYLPSALVFIVCVLSETGPAYPEFQAFSQKHSGKTVDCAMCHMCSDGPYGTKPGQVSSLNAKERDLLTQARNASKPGQDVQSPILNDFGNHIVRVLGGDRIRDLVKKPQSLADALGYSSDLDGDGIPDAREYLEGTNPLNAQSGAPSLLFANNMRRYWLDILMTTLLTIAGLYGLSNLFRWFTLATDISRNSHQ